MSGTQQILLAGGAGLNVATVFATTLYTGNNTADRAITTGIDLATKGGLIWIKERNSANSNSLFDSTRGAYKFLYSNTTGVEQNRSATPAGVASFTSTGFTVSDNADGYGVNGTGKNAVAWSIAKAAKFFDVQTKTVASGVSQTVDLSSLGTVGMVAVKRTDAVGSWYVWHRSLTAGKLLYLEQTAAEATLGHITLSGTTLTLEGGVIADGTYIVYAWAHDTAANGVIQCDTVTTAGTTTTVTLGWQPQFVILKGPAGYNWYMFDSTRGVPTGTGDARLYANTSDAEDTSNSLIDFTSTGFTLPTTTWGGAGVVLQYVAIRTP